MSAADHALREGTPDRQVPQKTRQRRAAAPTPSTADPAGLLLQLQRTVGNAAVTRLLANTHVQQAQRKGGSGSSVAAGLVGRTMLQRDYDATIKSDFSYIEADESDPFSTVEVLDRGTACRVDESKGIRVRKEKQQVWIITKSRSGWIDLNGITRVDEKGKGEGPPSKGEPTLPPRSANPGSAAGLTPTGIPPRLTHERTKAVEGGDFARFVEPWVAYYVERLRLDKIKVKDFEELWNLTGSGSKDERKGRTLELVRAEATKAVQAQVQSNTLKIPGKNQVEQVANFVKNIQEQIERTVLMLTEALAANGALMGVSDEGGALQSLGQARMEKDDTGPYLYVENLASAPWNVFGDDRQSVSGSVRSLMRYYVKQSMAMGGNGRIKLSPFNQSHGAYLSLGFSQPPSGGSWELTQEKAKALLDDRK